MGNKAGSPPKRQLRLLELWISLYYNGEINLDGKYNLNQLRQKFKSAKLYKNNLEQYETAVKRAKSSLETKKDHSLFICEKEALWSLSQNVQQCIKTEVFNNERKNNLEKAVRKLWESIRDNTWKEYYNPSMTSIVEVPIELQPFILEVLSSGHDPTWINPYGIHLEEIDEKYYPIITILELKQEFEYYWHNEKIPILIANPAQGKTTAMTIIGYLWQKDKIDNLVFVVDSIDWASVETKFKQFILTIKEPTKIIIIIENIHLITPIMSKIEYVTRNKNVDMVLTSRKHKDKLDQYKRNNKCKIIELPKKYSKELVQRFLDYHGNKQRVNKQVVRMLFKNKENQNILFLLTNVLKKVYSENFDWSYFVKNLLEEFIRSDIKDKLYWEWILYVLTYYKYYELEVTIGLFQSVIKYYDNSLSRMILGQTCTLLEEMGIIHKGKHERYYDIEFKQERDFDIEFKQERDFDIEFKQERDFNIEFKQERDFNIEFKQERYFYIVFHPQVSRKIFLDLEYEINNLFIEEDFQSDLFIIWIENYNAKIEFSKLLDNINRLIDKIGFEKYNKLQFNSSVVLNIIKENKPSLNHRIDFLKYNFQQENLSKILPKIFNDNDAKDFILLAEDKYYYAFCNEYNFRNNPLNICKKILPFLIEHINISKISLQDIFEECTYVIPGGAVWDEGGDGVGPGYAWAFDEYTGYQMFSFLSENHNRFKEEVETYLQTVYYQRRYDQFLEVFFRTPKSIIPKIDVNYIPKSVEFMKIISFKQNGLITDEFVADTYELMKLWNGPKFNEIREEIINYIVEIISKNQDFNNRGDLNNNNDQNQQFNSIYSEVEEWIDNLYLYWDIQSIDIKGIFDKDSFMIQKPYWIKNRLEFIAKYNYDLYEFIISKFEIKSKLQNIAEEWDKSPIFHDLSIRPSILDLSNNDVTINDIISINVDEIKKKIHENPFYDWEELINTSKKIVSGARRISFEQRELLINEIDTLENAMFLRRKTYPKDNYLKKIKEIYNIKKLKKDDKFDNILLKSFFSYYNPTYLEFLEIYKLVTSQINYYKSQIFEVLKLGYKRLDKDSKANFIKYLFSEKVEHWWINRCIDENDLLFTDIFLDSLNEEKSSSKYLLEDIWRIKSLPINNDRRLEFIKNILSLDLNAKTIAHIFKHYLPSKSEFHEEDYELLKMINSNYFVSIIQTLPEEDIPDFIRFLHDKWPFKKLFASVCNQLGPQFLAKLLYLIIKGNKFNLKSYKFLLEIDYSIDMIREYINLIYSKNNKESLNYLEDMYEFIIENEKLIKEFPMIIQKKISNEKLDIYDIINPREFGYKYNYELLFDIISICQDITLKFREDIQNLIIIWSKEENEYSYSGSFKAQYFVQLIDKIWNRRLFKQELKKWDNENKEILFHYLLRSIMKFHSKDNKITDNYSLILGFMKSIFEDNEFIKFFQDNISNIIFEENLQGFIKIIQIINTEFQKLEKEIFNKFNIDDFIFKIEINENNWYEEKQSIITSLLIQLYNVSLFLPFTYESIIRKYIQNGPDELIVNFIVSPDFYRIIEEYNLIEKVVNKLIQNKNQKSLVLELLLNIAHLNHFVLIWEYVYPNIEQKLETIEEFIYLVTLYQIILKIHPTLAEKILIWIKNNIKQFKHVIEQINVTLRIYYQYLLNIDLYIDIIRDKKALFNILINENVDYYNISDGINYVDISDKIQKILWDFNIKAVKPVDIFNYYWKNNMAEMEQFFESLNFNDFLKLLNNEQLFKAIVSKHIVMEIFAKFLKTDNVKDKSFWVRNNVISYDTINIDIINTIEKLLKSENKNLILDQLAHENYQFILRNLNYPLNISALKVIHCICKVNQNFEKKVILGYKMYRKSYDCMVIQLQPISPNNNFITLVFEDFGFKEQNNLEKLKFIKEKLPIIYKYEISHIKFENIIDYYNTQTSKDKEEFQETIWYLCQLEEWAEERKLLIEEIYDRSKFESIVELALIIKYLPNKIDKKIAKKIEDMKEILENKKERSNFDNKMLEILTNYNINN